MELTSKKKTERKKQNQISNINSKTYGVVITVYTESVTTRSRRVSEDPTKKTKPRQHFRSNDTTVTHGYDRRALLLAHSRDLRNAESQNVPLLTNHSRPKPKRKSILHERMTSKENKERNPNDSPLWCKMKNMLKQLSCKEI